MEGVFSGPNPNVTVIILFPCSCVKDRQSESAFSAGMLDEVNTIEEERMNTAHPATQEGFSLFPPGKRVQVHVQQSAQTKKN